MTAITAEDSRALLEPLTGYTTGPWTFETESGDWPDHALIGGNGDPIVEWDFDLGFRLSDLNARLIAAAPDLATHLRAALDREAALIAERDAALAEVNAMRESGSWFQEKDIDRLQTQVEAAEKMAEALRSLTSEGVFLDREYLSQSLNGVLDEACSALAAWDASRGAAE